MNKTTKLYNLICESDVIYELHNLTCDDWGLITFETASNYSLLII